MGRELRCAPPPSLEWKMRRKQRRPHFVGFAAATCPRPVSCGSWLVAGQAGESEREVVTQLQVRSGGRGMEQRQWGVALGLRVRPHTFRCCF